MEKFGTLLRNGIEESGYNIYNFAQLTGINRTSIQRYVTGQRFPDEPTFQVLLSHLQLLPKERERLQNAFNMQQIGKPLFLQRLHVKELLENASILYDSELPEKNPSGFSASFEQKDLTCRPGAASVFQGPYLTLNQFQVQLLWVSKSAAHPKLDLFLPAGLSAEFLAHALTTPDLERHRAFRIRQIFSLNRNPKADSEEKSHNMKVLEDLLPLCFSHRWHYEAVYYYAASATVQDLALIYPYYAILNDCVFLFSKQMDTCLLTTSPGVVEQYNQKYEERFQSCLPFSHSADRYEDIIQFLLGGGKKTALQEFWMEYSPCLTSVGSPEIADCLLREDIPFREPMLQMICRRFEQLDSSEEPMYHYFPEEGLIDFLETGTVMEFPLSLAKVVPLNIRLELLIRLREVCATDQQMLRIVNSGLFHVSRCLSVSVTEIQTLFFHYSGPDTWKVTIIPEAGISRMLLDFLKSLPDSPYVYSKAETLRILDKHIANMKKL